VGVADDRLDFVKKAASRAGLHNEFHHINGADHFGFVGGNTKFLRGDAQFGYPAGDAFTPAQITADQNDYAPAGTGTRILRLSSDVDNRQITGIVGGATGVQLIIENVGTKVILILHDSASSAAGNRIYVGPAVAENPFTLFPNQSVALVYDGTSSRWRMMIGVPYSRGNPVMLGAVAVGTSSWVSREDHVHPSVRDITTTTLTGTQNNLDSGLATADSIVWNGAVGNTITITGITGGVNGRQLIVVHGNISAGSITLNHENAGSTDVNRIEVPGAVSFVIRQFGGVLLYYKDNRWTVCVG
jgi:hypothetical protein